MSVSCHIGVVTSLPHVFTSCFKETTNPTINTLIYHFQTYYDTCVALYNGYRISVKVIEGLPETRSGGQ